MAAASTTQFTVGTGEGEERPALRLVSA
jgi:hypothetical protein